MNKEEIVGLKGSLECIEKNFHIKLKDVEEKQSNFQKMDEQLNELTKTKDNIVLLNIGGEIFKTKISTLLSKRDTLFYNLVRTNLENGTEMHQIFFDRPNQHFNFILDYLRTGTYSFKDFSHFEIEDLFTECEYYGLTEIVEALDEKINAVLFVNMQTAPKFKTFKNNLENLYDKKNLKNGVCVTSPYNIIIEFNKEHQITGMEVSGCANTEKGWSPTNGFNAEVFASLDNNIWTKVGNLPSDHGAKIQFVKLTPCRAKYVKFQHSYYLGLGYVKFTKKTF
jgi:hypothetical protein